MSIPDFLAAAADLHLSLSALCDTLAGLSRDMPAAGPLRALSREKARQANALRRANRDRGTLASLITGVQVDGDAVRRGIEGAETLRRTLLGGRASLAAGLRGLSALERDLAAILAAAPDFADISLNRAILNVRKKGQAHIALLQGLVDGPGEGGPGAEAPGGPNEGS
ncbi:MAG: hypothetical protein ABFD52_01815 [Acidobacteriota bacterium]